MLIINRINLPFWAFCTGVWLLAGSSFAQPKPARKPIILITDLYHPYQDPGDNFDLIMGYALPQVELKAVILDITDAFRKPVADHPTLWKDPRGPREAGYVPVLQLNAIFNRNVPVAMGPLTALTAETDPMRGISAMEQAGIELLLETLRRSPQPVEVLSFGSARVLAVAYNRDPALVRRKIRLIHLSAGTASANYALGSDAGANAIPGGEWNVALDVLAFTRLLRSDLPIAIYPCAGRDGAFVPDRHNTYWRMPTLDFIKEMAPPLRRYLNYAFGKSARPDYLRAMQADEAQAAPDSIFPRPHHVWETALWMQIAGLTLVKRADTYLITDRLLPTDVPMPGDLRPCRLTVRDDGRFVFDLLNVPTTKRIYDRGDPLPNQAALQVALPGLYKAFRR
jgi:pyrimidine-specific ribonucleoside hydrolase